MSLYYKTRGFVFKKEDRREADQILSLFTQDFGRIELLARAIRKITSKIRPQIDIFYFSEVEFVQGKNNKILIEASKIKNFGEDFFKIEILAKISYLIDIFVKGEQKEEELFNFLEDFLFNKILEKENKKKSWLFFQYFFWNFISFQGYKLELKNCLICGKKVLPEAICFSIKEGGMICEKCASFKRLRRVNPDVIKILRLILEKNFSTFIRLKVDDLTRRFLEDLAQEAIYSFSPSCC